jgi:hypothetical protein
MEPYDASTTPSDPAEKTDSPAEPFERTGSPEPAQTTGETRPQTDQRENMLPRRGRRRLGLERLLVRLIATCGIVGIGVALGAILASSKTQGWITGLVVALVTVVLSAILWSSRQL